MSDLQCPARILVARHGEAGYTNPQLLSDEGGWLTRRGRDQAAGLADRLRADRVAEIYTSRLNRAHETGTAVGQRLGLRASSIEGVQEFSVGSLAGESATVPAALEVFRAWVGGDLERRWPGAERGTEVVARFVGAIEELADRHRGETVLVVSHGGVMTLAIPNTATNTRADLALDAAIPNCAVAEVEVDSDGWRLVGPWPGRRWEQPDVDVGAPGAGDGTAEDAEPSVEKTS